MAEVHTHFLTSRQIAERRAQVPTTASDGRSFSGHAAVFNLPTYIGASKTGFYEQIAPGAFARALKSGADVRSVINHDPNLLLGRTSSGTLRLKEDTRGLHQETDLPDTSYARDLSELIRRGDVSGQSFQFTVADEAWSSMPGGHAQLRTIKAVDNLIDVGPVTYPAYADTTASVRSVGDADIRVVIISPRMLRGF